MSESLGPVTVLLRAVQDGKPGAVNELVGLIYGELRSIAQRQPGLNYVKDGPQPTALVHEVYLRLFGKDAIKWEDRHHFFWAASRAMRDILVEEARRCSAQKRGGNRKRVELSNNIALREQSERLLELDEILDRLAKALPEAANVVLLHFFGGLGHQQIADLLGVSTATVRRRWAFAKTWIRRELVSTFESSPTENSMSALHDPLRLV